MTYQMSEYDLSDHLAFRGVYSQPLLEVDQVVQERPHASPRDDDRPEVSRKYQRRSREATS